MEDHEIIFLVLLIILIFIVAHFLKNCRDNFENCKIVAGSDPANPVKVCGPDTKDLVGAYYRNSGETKFVPPPPPATNGSAEQTPPPEQRSAWLRFWRSMLGENFEADPAIVKYMPKSDPSKQPIVSITYKLTNDQSYMMNQIIGTIKPGDRANLCMVSKSIFNPATKITLGIPSDLMLEERGLKIGQIIYYSYQQYVFAGVIGPASPRDAKSINESACMLNDNMKINWIYLGSIYSFPEPANKLGVGGSGWKVFNHLIAFGNTAKSDPDAAPFPKFQSKYIVDCCTLGKNELFMFMDGAVYMFNGESIVRWR